MPDYASGKIYTIRCRTDDTMIYVGSTIQPLAKRWGGHKVRSKEERGKNRLIYKTINNDWENWYIELHILYPCNSKEELLQKEGEVIREMGTLNVVINGRTCKEWNDDNKEYQKQKKKEYRENPENREYLLQQKKEYYEKVKNTEAYINKSKEYREENKDKIINKVKKWCLNNPDKVKENRDKRKEYTRQYCKEYYQRKKEEKIKLIEEKQTL